MTTPSYPFPTTIHGLSLSRDAWCRYNGILCLVRTHRSHEGRVQVSSHREAATSPIFTLQIPGYSGEYLDLGSSFYLPVMSMDHELFIKET